NPEDARDQQRRQLDEMVALGYATQEEVDQSFVEYWANHDYTRSASTGAYLERLESDRAPWFSEHVRVQLETELLLGAANVFTDGYHVYTTLDLDYQEIAQEELWKGIQSANETYRRNQSNRESRIDRFLPMVEMLALGFGADNMRVGMSRSEARAEIYFRDNLAPLLDMVSMMFDTSEQAPLRQITQQAYLARQAVSGRTRVEGALVTLENETGYILAMVGGSPFEGGKNETNRAVDAYRPPGSSFKPLYYSAGINNGTITPATVYQDIPVTFTNSDGTAYTPSNYNGEWNGPTRVRYALATSMNVVSIRVLKDIGFTEAFNVAGRLLGLSESQMAQRGFERKYPVGLGTVSISPMLMARAFATFPSGGREVWPTSIRYIEDREGRTILEPAKDAQLELSRKGRSAQIINPQAAYIVTNMLESTVEFGTLRWRRELVGGFGDMAMAGKTGTTQNWSDAWTVGFSPYMTTAVWLGFDRGGNNSLGTNQTGAQTAGPVWAWYMKRVHENLPPQQFQRPADIVERTVTARTGLLPTESYEGSTIREVFIGGTQPTQFDTTEEWENERRTRITGILGRPNSSTGGGASLRDRIDTLGVFQSDPLPEEEDEQEGRDPAATTPGSESGLNPFLTPDEPERDTGRPAVNPFFMAPMGDETEEDEESDKEEAESNPMLD
ncbi:MAG: penicillin-binding transpeptidase domain-containing protein, partial [Spirochaetota bacterium]